MSHDHAPFHEHDDDGYEGPAVLTLDGARFCVEVKLAGYFQPIDGHYHWYGRIGAADEVSQAMGKRGKTGCSIKTPSAEVEGTLSEPDLWNRYRITGEGTPPFHVVATVEEVS